jgi:hypothetical protein
MKDATLTILYGPAIINATEPVDALYTKFVLDPNSPTSYEKHRLEYKRLWKKYITVILYLIR